MDKNNKYEGMPDANSTVCQVMPSKLECPMAKFYPVQLKNLEHSGLLQEFLDELSSPKRLV